MNAIEKAIRVLGTQQALATACGVTRQAVHVWVTEGRIPPIRCREIEEATRGVVTRYELRPDVFGAGPENWTDGVERSTGA